MFITTFRPRQSALMHLFLNISFGFFFCVFSLNFQIIVTNHIVKQMLHRFSLSIATTLATVNLVLHSSCLILCLPRVTTAIPMVNNAYYISLTAVLNGGSLFPTKCIPLNSTSFLKFFLQCLAFRTVLSIPRCLILRVPVRMLIDSFRHFSSKIHLIS